MVMEHNAITRVLEHIVDMHEKDLEPDSDLVLAPDVLSAAKEMLSPDAYRLAKRILRSATVYIPVQTSAGQGIHGFSSGRWDGYVQLDSGIIIQKEIADFAGLSSKPYTPEQRIRLDMSEYFSIRSFFPWLR